MAEPGDLQTTVYAREDLSLKHLESGVTQLSFLGQNDLGAQGKDGLQWIQEKSQQKATGGGTRGLPAETAEKRGAGAQERRQVASSPPRRPRRPRAQCVSPRVAARAPHLQACLQPSSRLGSSSSLQVAWPRLPPPGWPLVLQGGGQRSAQPGSARL